MNFATLEEVHQVFTADPPLLLLLVTDSCCRYGNGVLAYSDHLVCTASLPHTRRESFPGELLIHMFALNMFTDLYGLAAARMGYVSY